MLVASVVLKLCVAITVGFELFATELKKSFPLYSFRRFLFFTFCPLRFHFFTFLLFFHHDPLHYCRIQVQFKVLIIMKLFFMEFSNYRQINFCYFVLYSNLKLSDFQLAINYISTTSDRARIQIKARDE